MAHPLFARKPLQDPSAEAPQPGGAKGCAARSGRSS
jgi:hypothetical protein